MALDGQSDTKNASHLAPGVFKVVRMIETLRTRPAGLRVDHISELTGYPRTTVRRILRTLTACEYTVRGGRGLYRLSQDVVSSSAVPAQREEAGIAADHRARTDIPIVFERWGVRFLTDGRRIRTTVSPTPPTESLGSVGFI